MSVIDRIDVTDSGALSANAEALRTLAKLGRFRIVRSGGRMVVGYWPENDLNAPLTGSKQPEKGTP